MSGFFASHLTLVQQGLVYSILAISLQVALRAGIFSFASIGFMTLGQYTAAQLALHHWPVVAIFLVALSCSIPLALAVAVLTARLRQLYLAMATVAFDLVIPVLAISFSSITGGALGLYAIPVLVSTWEVFGILVFICALAVWAERGPLGRRLTCIRQDEELALTLGIKVGRTRASVFVISSLLGVTAGVAYALMFYAVSPGNSGFDLIVLVLTMVIVGGQGSWLGAVIGAIFLVWLPNWLQAVGQWNNLVYGVLLVLVILFNPSGALGIIGDLIQYLRRFGRVRASAEQASGIDREAERRGSAV